VFTKSLWDQRRSLVGWIVAVTAVGVLYAAFYPIINTPDMAAAMDAFPPAMRDAMGFTDMTSAAGYLGSTTFGLLGPVLIIVMGAALGGSAIAGDEEGGRLDLTLAHPVSRWLVLVERFAALIVAMLLTALVLWLALLAISGPAQLGELSVTNLAAASLHLAVFGIFFGALALAVGAATGSRALAFGVLAVVAIGAFFGNNLGPTVQGLEWLRDISPFHYYSGSEPLRNGVALIDLTVLAVAALVLVGLGGLRFDRRDIAV